MSNPTHIPGTPDTTGRTSPWDDYAVGTQELRQRRLRTGRANVRARATLLRSLGEVVYAVRVGDVVKIGHTGNLAARYNALGADELLAFKPGTFADEQALHTTLVDHLHHGREWYYPTPGVLTVVNEMRATLGMEPIAA